MKCLFTILLVFLTVLFGVPVRAEVITLHPTDLATIFFSGSESPAVIPSSGVVPVITVAGQDIRSAVEFDLSAIPLKAVIHLALLKVTEDLEDSLGALSVSELHGYDGNGVVEWTDAGVTNVLAAGYLDGHYNTNSVDVTTFIQSLVKNTKPFAGFLFKRHPGVGQSVPSLATNLELIIHFSAPHHD